MKKKQLPIIISTLIIFLSGCGNQSVVDSSEEKPQIYSIGERIFYSGDISQSGFEKVKALMSKNKTTLVIKSRGGNIVPAMKLGELIFDNNLNVDVLDYCFSSCANYIFPAGEKKYLSKGSQLGWHGGATQRFNGDIVPTKETDRVYFIQVMTDLIHQENEFFKKIKVNQLVTTYGQSTERYLEMLKAHKINCEGWSYSLDALSAFGINGVILKDGEWQPDSSYKNSCIHRFEKVTTQNGSLPEAGTKMR